MFLLLVLSVGFFSDFESVGCLVAHEIGVAHSHEHDDKVATQAAEHSDDACADSHCQVGCHFGHCQNQILPSAVELGAVEFSLEYQDLILSAAPSPILEGLRRPPRV